MFKTFLLTFLQDCVSKHAEKGVAITVSAWGKVLPIASLVLSSLVSMTAEAAIPASERTTLLNLYVYTNGAADWINNTGWNGPPGSECSWFGVVCDSTEATVTAINLSGNNLSGSLPSLVALTNLTQLDVGNTNLNVNLLLGCLPSFAGMVNLQYVRASNQNFSCSLPAMTNLPKLAHFDVSRNNLTGNMPAVAGLSNLSYFDASTNQLSGGIPPLTGLSNLAYFDVDSNLLTGSIPSLQGLSNLNNFNVSSNQLTGSIPDLSGLNNLTSFGVSVNQLTGAIPPSFSNLKSLEGFSIAFNHLTGGIPALSGLTKLTGFGMEWNELTGNIPAPPAQLTSGSAAICPNQLNAASSPPSAIDSDWNAITGTTPWSLNCAQPQQPTYLWLTTSAPISVFGRPVTLTAEVYGRSATGTVTFTSTQALHEGTTTLCSDVTLVASVAICTTNNFQQGSSNVVVAAYSGDTQNAPVNSQTNSVYIDQVVTSAVAESTSANPVQIGEPVDLVATLTGGLSSDTLTFLDGDTALCKNVGVRAEQSQLVAHCVTTFLTTGDHSLTMTDASASAFQPITIPLIQSVIEPVAFDANQFALTGAWYNSATDGQGMLLDVFPDKAGVGTGALFAAWFTFDTSGNQQWFTFQGNLAAAHGNSYTVGLYSTTGGNFNAPPITQAVPYGSATLTVYDCTHAALTYNFSDGRTGTIPYERLSNSIGCSSAVPAVTPNPGPLNYSDVLHSGAWYNTPTSGQGVLLDISPSQTTFFGALFTYAPQSEGLSGLAGQRWFTLQSNNYVPGQLTLANVLIYSTTGGIFNTPSSVVTTQVGNANITISSCTSMTINYAFDAGEFKGLAGSIEEQAMPAVGCE